MRVPSALALLDYSVLTSVDARKANAPIEEKTPERRGEHGNYTRFAWVGCLKLFSKHPVTGLLIGQNSFWKLMTDSNNSFKTGVLRLLILLTC